MGRGLASPELVPEVGAGAVPGPDLCAGALVTGGRAALRWLNAQGEWVSEWPSELVRKVHRGQCLGGSQGIVPMGTSPWQSQLVLWIPEVRRHWEVRSAC